MVGRWYATYNIYRIYSIFEPHRPTKNNFSPVNMRMLGINPLEVFPRTLAAHS